jgi:hypothetical protein
VSIVEQITIAAQKLAQKRGISDAAAYAEDLQSNPSWYRMAMEERADGGAVGITGSLNYAREARRRGLVRA